MVSTAVGVRLRIEDHHLPGRRCEVGDLASDRLLTQTATIDLTDDDGMPRCARLRPPAVQWSRS